MYIDNQIRRSETYRNPVRILVRGPDFWSGFRSGLEPGPVRGTDLGSELWSGPDFGPDNKKKYNYSDRT